MNTSVARVITTLKPPAASSFVASILANERATSFSTIPLTMAPVSGPPWPGSRTIVALPGASGAAAGVGGRLATSGATLARAAARKLSRSVFTSSIVSRALSPTLRTAATTRAGALRSMTMRERPGASRPKRNEDTSPCRLTRPRPLKAGRPTEGSSAKSTCGRSTIARSGSARTKAVAPMEFETSKPSFALSGVDSRCAGPTIAEGACGVVMPWAARTPTRPCARLVPVPARTQAATRTRRIRRSVRRVSRSSPIRTSRLAEHRDRSRAPSAYGLKGGGLTADKHGRRRGPSLWLFCHRIACQSRFCSDKITECLVLTTTASAVRFEPREPGSFDPASEARPESSTAYRRVPDPSDAFASRIGLEGHELSRAWGVDRGDCVGLRRNVGLSVH